MDSTLKKEPLGNGCFVYTTAEYRFGTDSVLLANFLNPKSNDTVCDLGCGSGIIPMLLCRDMPSRHVAGVDIQQNAAELCEKAANENGFENLKVICADLKNLKPLLPMSSFDIVCCNPPYKTDGAGIKNPNKARMIARHETECTFSDVASAAKALLRSGGRFCVCHRPERLADIMCAMRENRLEPKRLRTVHQRKNEQPWLVLVEGRRDGKSGMRIMPPLYIEENGELSSEMREIYGIYKTKIQEG